MELCLEIIICFCGDLWVSVWAVLRILDIHLINSLSSYYVPDTAVDTEDTVVCKTDIILAS